MSEIADYCRSREALLRALRHTKRERAEVADEERTRRRLLTEQMRGQSIRCVRVEGGYVRLMPPPARTVRLRSVEDAVSLLEGIEEHVGGGPDAIAAYVRERARVPNVEAPPRVGFTKTMPRTVTDASSMPTFAEADAYASAREEARRLRMRLRPLRDDLREASRALTPVIPEHGAIVRIEGPGVQRSVRVDSRTVEKPFKVRTVVDIVRKSAAALLLEGRTTPSDLGAALRVEVERELRSVPRTETRVSAKAARSE